MHLPSIELPFFTNLLLLLFFARILGELFERFKQPAMIGEIIAGMILGPSLFNIMHRTEELKTISELGVFLLVIIAGLEINFDDILKSFKGKNLIISLLAFFIPILSGFVVGYIFGLDIMTTLFTGLCIAITALPVSVRILMDLGKINTDLGQKIISVAIFDDIIALTILGILLNVKNTDMSLISVLQITGISLLKLIAFLVILTVVYILMKKVTNKENFVENQLNSFLDLLKGKESLHALFFVFVLLFATVTETLGFHFIVGAFFAAMFIDDKLVGKKHLKSFHDTTNGLAMGFLAPIFFAGIGLEFNISSISNYYLLTVILFFSFFTKICGGYIGGVLAGYSSRFSFTLGIGLNARGIMELVIANIAYKAGLINSEMFSILVIMGIVTTLSTPFLLKSMFKSKSIA